MAVFNPPISNTPSHNYINYSQGTTPNRSLATLFAGIGDAVKTGFQEKDNYEKAKIDKTIAGSIEGIDTEILGATPQELIDGKVSADKIRSAYDQGKLSATYRDSRIARTAKELTLKYPQHTQYIWNNISNMAGTSPMGNLISDYSSEIKSAQNDADANAKELRAFVNNNGEYIGSETFQNAYKAATKSDFDPTNFDYETAQTIINKQKAYKENLTLQHAEITAAKDQKSWSEEVNYDKVSNILTESRTQIFNDAANSPAPSLTGEYKSIYQAIQTAAANPNAVSEEERMAIAQSLVQLEMDMSTYADSLFAAKNSKGVSINSTITDPAKRKQLKEEFLAPLQVLKDAVTNKDYGTLNAIATENKMKEDSTKKKVLGATGDLATKFAKADEMIGKEARQTLVRNILTGVAGDEEKVLAQSLGLDILMGEKTVTEAYTDYDKAGGYKLNSTAPTQVLLNVPDAILAMPKEQAAQTAEKVYADPAFLAKLTQANSIAVFEKYVNPKMTELLKGTSAWDEYTRWSQGNFATVLKKFEKDTVGVLSDLPGAEITFNYNTGRYNAFVPPANIPTDPGMGGGRGAAYITLNRQNIQKANEAVATINRWLDAVSPIVEANGFSKEDAPVLALQQGFDSRTFGKIKGQAPGGILDKLLDGFIKGVQDGLKSPEGQKLNEGATDRRGKSSSNTRSIINYANSGATRNLKLDNKLEARVATAVETVFGPGYSVQVFSGGQPKKGTSSRRTGSIRHDEGKAADVYIIDPQGNRVTDTGTLGKLKAYWLENDMGSVGTYMRGAGMHLDEWTKEELLAGMASSWRY